MSYYATISCEMTHNGADLIVQKLVIHIIYVGTAVAQWLRYCATNQKVADSIPEGVIVIFHSHKSF
jgi:hypothetical protein